jgi:hypothetical protein
MLSKKLESKLEKKGLNKICIISFIIAFLSLLFILIIIVLIPYNGILIEALRKTKNALWQLYIYCQ